MNRSPSLLGFALLAILAGCSKEQPAPSGAGSVRLPLGPAASARPVMSATAAVRATGATTVTAPGSTTALPPGPRWLSVLPSRPVSAKPGERVWAVVPATGEAVRFGVYELESSQGNTGTVLGLLPGADGATKDPSAKHALVPGALMSPASDLAKLKVGDIVITPVAGDRVTAAHITKLDGKRAYFKFVRGEKTDDESSAYAAPLATGIAPFAFVAFKSGSTYMEGLVAAVVDDRVFAIDEQGRMLSAPKAEVKPLDVQWKARKKGDQVTVFDESGMTETTIEAASVAKWVFQVKVGGALKRVPFYAVVDKL